MLYSLFSQQPSEAVDSNVLQQGLGQPGWSIYILCLYLGDP